MTRIGTSRLSVWSFVIALGFGMAAAAEPAPSAGCVTTPGKDGNRKLSVEGKHYEYIVSLPEDYGANKPYPLAIGFKGYFQNELEDKAVLVQLKPQGPGWTQPLVSAEVAAHHLRVFGKLLETVRSDYCIDEQRVIVAGESSGGAFANAVGCRYGDKLLAVVPVAGWQPTREGCKGNPAVMVIHGIDDKIVPVTGGEEARDFFAARNQCGPAEKSEIESAHKRVRAARDEGRGDYACVDYPGCKAGAVRWCLHSEGGHDNSNHPWPSVAGDLIWEFVQSPKR